MTTTAQQADPHTPTTVERWQITISCWPQRQRRGEAQTKHSVRATDVGRAIQLALSESSYEPGFTESVTVEAIFDAPI